MDITMACSCKHASQGKHNKRRIIQRPGLRLGGDFEHSISGAGASQLCFIALLHVKCLIIRSNTWSTMRIIKSSSPQTYAPLPYIITIKYQDSCITSCLTMEA